MMTAAGPRFPGSLAILAAAALLAAAIAPPVSAARFIRGDADENGDLEITDAVRTLSHLFLGNPGLLGCADAADADDNGTLEITDPVAVLGHLFLGEAPLPSPYPFCGLDPTPDNLGCESHQGCAGVPCGGFLGIPCDEGFICDPIPGACSGADLPGECIPKTDVCPKIFDPVCGCDGFTYVNDCERLRAGVQKDHDGACDPSQICGGIIGLPCDMGEFCDLPPGSCEGADFQGICVPQRDACPEIFDPVCGCDGKTYSNDCERIAAGVQKRHDGECGQVTVCGGFAGIPCDRGEFCDLPPGTCEGAEFQGICVDVVDPCPRVFEPVCGCDDRTYPNDCERILAGVQKRHDGACDEFPVCGGITGQPCEDRTHFCDFPPGTCGKGDVQGVCRPRPEICLTIFDPVCGCDGKTYSNDCVRAAAGVSKLHDGPCDAAR